MNNTWTPSTEWTPINAFTDRASIFSQNSAVFFYLKMCKLSINLNRTNCATNPYCLNGIGEKKLLNLMQKEVNNTLDKFIYFRKPNEHVGLVNLGATCYINAYLQVRFVFVFLFSFFHWEVLHF